MAWDLPRARDVAVHELGDLGMRWEHVQGVGRLAEALHLDSAVPEVVACAAWLHDVGYAPARKQTGMHAIDGAQFLQSLGAPEELVGLVAHHTGAAFEAEQRGLVHVWEQFPEPDRSNLDILTLLDLVTGPDGTWTDPHSRVVEILGRYAPDTPVHRAVSRSTDVLIHESSRARRRLGLPDEWPLSLAQGVF